MNFYVYVFLNPLVPGKFNYLDYSFDFEPFYIGKGSNNRIKKHKFYLKTDNTLKYKKFRKIQENGFQPITMKISDNLSEIEAFLLETNLINIIGRIDLKSGPLCNLTSGGEGVSGRKVDNKTRNKISNSLKKCGRIYSKHTEEYKEMMSLKFKGRVSPSKGRILSIDDKLKISESQYKKILQFDKNMTLIKEYPAILIASKETNIDKGSISKCCNNKLKSAGGFIWRFK